MLTPGFSGAPSVSAVGSVRPQQRANEFLLRLQPLRTIAPVAELLDHAAM
jgi:hypothetical protein